MRFAKHTVQLHEYAHLTVFISLLWTDTRLPMQNWQCCGASGAFKSSPWAITLKTPVENISPTFLSLFMLTAPRRLRTLNLSKHFCLFQKLLQWLLENKKVPLNMNETVLLLNSQLPCSPLHPLPLNHCLSSLLSFLPALIFNACS